MKQYIFTLLILILSCDSIDQLEVQEYESTFTYYDYVAYGWAEFLKENYDLSISYFEQALLTNDVDEDGINDFSHNSAYVGLSYVYTYIANSSLDEDDDEETNT